LVLFLMWRKGWGVEHMWWPHSTPPFFVRIEQVVWCCLVHFGWSMLSNSILIPTPKRKGTKKSTWSTCWVVWCYRSAL
jgi:hypothetical protein